MPARKSPPSLEKLSWNKIAENIDSLHDSVKMLSNWFLERLFKVLVKNRHRPRKSLADCFIRPETQKLEDLKLFISKYSPREAELIVARISRVCLNLTNLSLAGIPPIAELTLLNLIPNIPQIKNLNLSKSKCTDNVLAAMNRHSLHLQHLVISHCQVTDAGIDSFCQINTKTNIELLDIRYTRITPNGALRILKILTALLVFSYHLTGDTLRSVKGQNDILPLPNLQSLFPYKISSEHELAIAADLFPGLRQLSSCYMKKGSTQFARFETLNAFTIQHFSRSPYVSAEGDVVGSVLLNVNHRLTSLFLQNVHQLDVGVIAKHFPLLEILTLHETSVSDRSDRCVDAFQHLRELDIDVKHSSISLPNLKFLLARSLRDVYLCRCDSLTDEAVVGIFTSMDGYRNLKYLYFVECDSMSAKAVMALLIGKETNVLREIYVIDCARISRRDQGVIERYIESENLDVRICWKF